LKKKPQIQKKNAKTPPRVKTSICAAVGVNFILRGGGLGRYSD
jgi:hypothetical protein